MSRIEITAAYDHLHSSGHPEHPAIPHPEHPHEIPAHPEHEHEHDAPHAPDHHDDHGDHHDGDHGDSPGHEHEPHRHDHRHFEGDPQHEEHDIDAPSKEDQHRHSRESHRHAEQTEIGRARNAPRRHTATGRLRGLRSHSHSRSAERSEADEQLSHDVLHEAVRQWRRLHPRPEPPSHRHDHGTHPVTPAHTHISPSSHIFLHYDLQINRRRLPARFDITSIVLIIVRPAIALAKLLGPLAAVERPSRTGAGNVNR